MTPLQAPSAALDEWLACSSAAGLVSPAAAAVDDNIQAVRRSVQICAAAFRHMEAVADAAEAVCPCINLAMRTAIRVVCSQSKQCL